MMNGGLSAFLAQNVIEVENEKVIVSKRFLENGKPICWEIRALSEEENETIRKACVKKIKNKGVTTQETDYNLYLGKLIAESVVYPNLKDADLQKSYGVLGADSLIKKMLKSGEYATLVEKVQEINGFSKDMSDLVEEAKN
jgi:hypothetical protein